MNEYEVNCIMRILAKFAYAHVSSNPDLVRNRDNGGWTRIYECYESLKEGVPETMERTVFFAKFANIEYSSAVLTVRKMEPILKQHIVKCLLHMARYHQTDIAGGIFTCFGDLKDTLNLLEEIAIETQIMTLDLQQKIKYAREYQ